MGKIRLGIDRIVALAAEHYPARITAPAMIAIDLRAIGIVEFDVSGNRISAVIGIEVDHTQVGITVTDAEITIRRACETKPSSIGRDARERGTAAIKVSII